MYRPIYVMEYDNTKDPEKYSKYGKFVKDEWYPYMDKLEEENLCRRNVYADNTGHIISILEFKDFDTFSKVWNDHDWQNLMIKYFQLVENARIRFCRPARVLDWFRTSKLKL